MSDSDITVVGAGLAGLSCAWALQQKGWRVSVLEAREGVALETSFANAGMLTPSMADPWNAPGIWRKLLAWLGEEDAPMLLRASLLPAYLRWGLRFLLNSRRQAHQQATLANYALARLSLRAFHDLRAHVQWPYDLRTQGTLQVFKCAREFEAARRHADFLQEQDCAVQLLDPSGIARHEPVLAPVAERYCGGVQYPDDETGDARRFCLGLEAHLKQQGVQFEFGQALTRIRSEGGRLVALHTTQGERPVRQLVLATAAHTPMLLRGLGFGLSIRPVKGYSLTVPASASATLPKGSIIDHHQHTALTPLHGRVRIAGTAEFSGWDARLLPGRVAPLWRMLDELLPQQHEHFQRAEAVPWCGFRPMAADCVPYIGPSPLQGLHVCAGHGHLGWTHSLGSGRLLAALLSGDTTPIDPRPYRVLR